MSMLQKGCLSVVLGAQWGDKGKDKLPDILCTEAEICARCAGGNNVVHIIVVGDIKYNFHVLPSGPKFNRKYFRFLAAASFISTSASSIECNSE
ncbi:hypothetical protein G6F56_008843 [Rhizopus delemar]|nr:hypothetical protein G6F56_008843 [Rhizopus delemar]